MCRLEDWIPQVLLSSLIQLVPAVLVASEGFGCRSFAGVSSELYFQAQKGPTVPEVVLGSPLQCLVSVLSAVFFSPSGSGWLVFFFS